MKKPFIVVMEKPSTNETRRILVFAESGDEAMRIMWGKHYHYWIVSHAIEHDTETQIQVY